MEREKGWKMSEEAILSRKLRKALQLLLFQHHRLPGAKGWELRKALGKDYLNIIRILNKKLEDLGLEIKIIHESKEEEDLDKARFYIVFKSISEELSSWRIDTLAILAVSIAYIATKNSVKKQELQELLKEKFPDWKIDQELNMFIRRGYLEEKDENLYIGWRTKAEVDIKKLIESIAGYNIS
ncbi:MAG: hypothetical protein DSO09_00240 [Candidatus Methanomethylicota archaeon]|uniref:MAGE domain-containing protein n=2 Tax=Thermoproteota archaeon TaxID=2056631 RepID=A0A523BHX7_9CREN|nr:MAG: hypothetical protein DSO09_00240 [Candidatus Verstraetearchaeota archaeon]